MNIKNRKFKLIQKLPSLREGAIFVWNAEYGEFTHDIYSTQSYYFSLFDMINNEDFFEEILAE